jgi:hypothetical protein
MPEGERAALAEDRDDPKRLARLATRAEMRQPGMLERIFGGRGRGADMGGMMGGNLFGSLVAGFVGSMIAEEFFNSVGDPGFGEGDPSTHPEDAQTDDSTGEDSGYETTDDSGGDAGDWGEIPVAIGAEETGVVETSAEAISAGASSRSSPP